MQAALQLNPGQVSLKELSAVADGSVTSFSVTDESQAAVKRSADIVERVLQQDAPVYGVNTGFGKLASVKIDEADAQTLQRNLILSHCAGVGAYTDPAIVRLMMVLKVNSLARGASGVRWQLIEIILQLLNHSITPLVPSQGSVGASGDLAPLAHFAAALIGEGQVLQDGKPVAAATALAAQGITPVTLAAKEGLALINGTQFSTASALVALFSSWRLAQAAVVTSALSTDAIMGSTAPLREEIHELRGHRGQIDVASAMRDLMQNSEIRDSHREDDTRVQDPYCIRCQPQVTGACVELLRQSAGTLLVEANAVTDNPLVVADALNPETSAAQQVLSGGNFHAEPVAFAADQIALATAEIGAIAQRRVALMVDPALSFDLPPFLTPEPGLNSGFMVAEISTAALMSENKHLANPCSTDSTPTSANQEDHVSMAAHGAQRLHRMNANLMNILAVEYLCASRGIEFRAPLKTSQSLQQAINLLRQHVSSLQQDRYIATDITAAARLIASGMLERTCAEARLTLI